MKHTGKALLLVLLIGLVVWAVSDATWAQRGRVGSPSGTGAYQYVVKFLCGFFSPAVNEELAPGFYYTDVNVHNPNDGIITFRKKIALDGWQPQHHGGQTSPIDVTLGPDEALEINCSDIFNILERAGMAVIDARSAAAVSASGSVQAQNGVFPLLKGFVVLYSKVKLDVAAIYSAACGCDGIGPGEGISTIQVDELIPPSPVPAPAVFIRGLSVSSAGVNLSVRPFSQFAYDGARLMVYDANGRMLHDSGFTSGTQLSWKPLSVGKPLANGVYFYVVEVRDLMGQVAYKVGKFILLR